MLRRLLFPLAVVLLLGQMAFAMVTTAVEQSPTIDEPVYVSTAEVYRQQHIVLYNPEHPPLAKLVMAAGLAFTHAKLDPGFRGNQTQLGRHLLYETGNNPFRLMLAARLPMIVLTLLFGLVVFFFARDLAGRWAGLMALALYAFSPDVIAHGSLATLDVPAAGLLLTTFWMLWRSRERPGLYLPLAGVALGASLATRMSALPAIPMVLLLVLLSPAPWVLRRLGGAVRSSGGVAESGQVVPSGGRLRAAVARVRSGAGWREFGLRVVAAIGVGIIAAAVVWVVYLAVDPRLRWTTPAGLPHPGGLRGLAVDLLPLPKAYRDGVLIQFKFESETFNGFLLGRAYQGSLWYYLPVALLIKMPLGMLALWVIGTLTLLAKRTLRVASLYLIAPAAVLMLVAMTGARDYGTRYVIFMPMFFAIVASTVVLTRVAWVKVAAVLLVVFVAVSSVRTFPYYLPYSNEAFGGTANTHNNLHDANVDWGQDLARLATHLRQRYPGQPVWLSYKGSGVPGYYGIHAKNPTSVPIDQVHGLLVVSDSRVALASGRLKQLIDTSTPIDEVGYSITIYRRP
ncbi:phospholipid carrier-dependent glycosyltransferase [Actinoplanes sp. TBRC 11911]|uniref:ArnT family glycosyltransferase n=1 Tax=Actinoplanes sp. TBRC 11911 TaxID=2729386 RepID=UPI00145D00BB|nr:glycosyltransferase family 39 protein [Actinoplanes sp. TBRC 11911]NMO53318.1 phospholipid carrier-dependent glycosyltransferase [Actinoplanes sp. TBRC 11911]